MKLIDAVMTEVPTVSEWFLADLAACRVDEVEESGDVSLHGLGGNKYQLDIYITK